MLTNIHCNHEKLISYFINTSFSFTVLQKDFAKRIMRHCSLVNRVHSFTLL